MKLIITFFLLISFILFGQSTDRSKDTLYKDIYGGLQWRNIGPAYCSGRISDFAVNPANISEYYIAVSSGNIWKTTNAGTTFQPIFDNYGAYSIACITIDPNNPYSVWTGTGENNHQRALGYGDGVYKSTDGGKSWKNMGLKESRQIGDIIIDPRNSNVVYVAAEGSVWGPGGDRGLYKTLDGGTTWKKVLEISENTGVNNVILDPSNPDVLYATSEQRRRHVFTKIGGGPESAVYKSTDAGETWNKIMSGLPSVDLGGMGIDISPVNPDMIYLSVEAAENKSGLYKSVNRGATWEKVNDYTSSGQYFNEIYCDPSNADVIYLMDVVSKVSVDGGKTYKNLSIRNRHVDDHALWINPKNSKHFLIGGDGGVYETFDGGEFFDFKENLPVAQFYRVSVDNSEPFYNVFGGTQDNNSMGGPSRTIKNEGIVNSDWFETNGGDGFWTAVDPENPNIVYAESQYGGMVRFDRNSGEAIDIRPEPKKGELTFKWNWDTPLLISPHKNTRLYCAANFVFKSDDRGESWTRISDDLTRQIDRNTFQVMGKYWSIDAVAKDKSTSLFGTIVSLTESSVKENLLYAGTDDGLIQVSEDGKTWNKIDKFPGVPEYTYVSDILPSKFDENIVFATFNNLKRDDFKPYVLISKDKGASWKSISSNLPANGSVHTIEQDYLNPDLLFVGTEFGFFFSTNSGDSWTQLKNGLPTISVKDIAIQKRESDLVLATFGRGFYVLDDYSPLRKVSESSVKEEGFIFPLKDALSYIKSYGKDSQGSNYFKAPNPEYGANIYYYLKEVPKTLNQIRKENEKKLFKDSKPIPQPSPEEIRLEAEEIEPYLVFTLTDASGKVIRRLFSKATKGINKINWDLSYHAPFPLDKIEKYNPMTKGTSGTPVLPGDYQVSMSLVTREGIKTIGIVQNLKVRPINNSSLPQNERKELVEFQKRSSELVRKVSGTQRLLNENIEKVKLIRQTLLNTPESNPDLLSRSDEIARRLTDLTYKFDRKSSSPSAEENPPSPPTLNERLGILYYTHYRSTANVTQTEKNTYEALTEEIIPVASELSELIKQISVLDSELNSIKAPWTPGREIK
ncbi:MAG: WD40/YVTN/BNR-like repeat-containing protein [Ignavibacteriaceae bacterium]